MVIDPPSTIMKNIAKRKPKKQLNSFCSTRALNIICIMEAEKWEKQSNKTIVGNGKKTVARFLAQNTAITYAMTVSFVLGPHGAMDWGDVSLFTSKQESSVPASVTATPISLFTYVNSLWKKTQNKAKHRGGCL